MGTDSARRSVLEGDAPGASPHGAVGIRLAMGFDAQGLLGTHEVAMDPWWTGVGEEAVSRHSLTAAPAAPACDDDASEADAAPTDFSATVAWDPADASGGWGESGGPGAQGAAAWAVPDGAAPDRRADGRSAGAGRAGRAGAVSLVGLDAGQGLRLRPEANGLLTLIKAALLGVGLAMALLLGHWVWPTGAGTATGQQGAAPAVSNAASPAEAAAVQSIEEARTWQRS